MTTRRFGLIFCSTVLFAAAAFGSEVYRNDFSTRTSQKPVPSEAWHEMKYQSSQPLAYSYLNGDYAVGVPYSDLKKYQDSWAKMKTSGTGQQPNFKVISKNGNKFVSIDSSVCASVDDTAITVLTPFYNDFTTGVVRICCDFACRASTLSTDSAYVRLTPLFKSHLKPDPSPLATKMCVTAFGLNRDAGKPTAILISANNGEEGSAASNLAKKEDGDTLNLTDGHWYRFEMLLDMDAEKAGGYVYDMGEDQPTVDSVGVRCGTFFKDDGVGHQFYYKLREPDGTPKADGRGPMSGFALKTSKLKRTGMDDTAKAPAVDNVTVGWKAPGTSEFVSVYENDFTTRKYRILEPAGATAASYAATGSGPYEEKITMFYSDADRCSENNQLIRLAPDFVTGQDPQPVGMDGWRRIGQGYSEMTVVNWANGKTKSGGSVTDEEGGAVVRVTGLKSRGQNNFVYAGLPLGEEVTTGKVSFRADVKIPGTWTLSSSLKRCDVALILADTAVYEASSISGHYAIRGGITGNTTGTDNVIDADKFVPYCNAPSGYTTDSTELESNSWYRVEITADMDTKKGSLKVWSLGKKSRKSTATPGDLLYENTDIDFKSDIGKIGTAMFYISGNNVYSDTSTDPAKAYSITRFVCFDNVIVTKNVGTADERQIYLCAFSSRTRSFDEMNSGTLIGSFNNTDGVDDWIRRGSETGEARVVSPGDGQQAAAVWSVGGDGVFPVQSFGGAIRTGSFQVDVRPPASWNANSVETSKHQVTVALGGDDLLQGYHDVKEGQGIAYSSAASFGFINHDAAKRNALGAYSDMTLYVWDGSGTSSTARKYSDAKVKTSHWYRFRAKFDCKANPQDWSLDVFDMGSSQPTAQTPDGELVASWDGLEFRDGTVSRMSAFYLSSRGNVPALANDPNDPNITLFDNVCVTKPDSLLIILK